ncbi:anhydro-N-acetylmuramic acid kinase [Moraxella cuniculi DSM 21768]|uniref:Anhydro-N-acetylmuramic acid kinase n=1 Tax=Moraxella cuniculi DSM 21768 TaxID=1122245 RepID=A0A1N7DUT0_9GAMM|nr:anhydro-N-acetylmuramic acid kinase [Moraxella cuniculi]OOS07416.1 anhydro-N-acetylmuramic acid kinase [Moraxella cuniculi]SIR79594.1 anhydro-N-acetylmuramic acid kinase [Moraxella cuniculi DSM 21768]
MATDFVAQMSQLFDDAQDLMADTPYFIGMMSGTSLDAMDAVLCQFFDDERTVEIVASHSLPFADDLRAVLLALTVPNGTASVISDYNLGFDSELDVFGWASVYYASFAAQVVIELLEKANINSDKVCAIGCHGQTVRHRPQWAFSLQLIDPNLLAEYTGISVVSDFRRRDMAVGGQGAPLVPAFHQAMFGNHAAIKAVLNLGGIANITLLNQPLDSTQVGFDTGVANLLMDAWIAKHTGKPYDKDGAWAASGQVIEPLLQLLLSHPFFAKKPPKSTGREEFHLAWLNNNLEKLHQNHPSLSYQAADVQATLAELTAISAASEISRFVDDGVLVVCGGGAKNQHLMRRLQAHLPTMSVRPSDEFGIDVSLVESVAFAWLARQTILGRTGNLPAATGASRAVVLGQVCFA